MLSHEVRLPFVTLVRHLPNASPVVFVEGEQRIAIFAKKDIKEGEELFFDYQYILSLGTSLDNGKDQMRSGKKRKK